MQVICEATQVEDAKVGLLFLKRALGSAFMFYFLYLLSVPYTKPSISHRSLTSTFTLYSC